MQTSLDQVAGVVKVTRCHGHQNYGPQLLGWSQDAIESVASNLPPILGGCPLIGGFWLQKAAICPLFALYFSENPLFFSECFDIMTDCLVFWPWGTNPSQGDHW